ncbi:MAG: radical SAM protein [Candidatus Margulisiibacteriota bacterium]
MSALAEASFIRASRENKCQRAGGAQPAIRKTTGRLVTYCPMYAPNAMMPDNGLALLAAVTNAAGHDVKVMDYNTTDSMRRLIPPFWSRCLDLNWKYMISPRYDNPNLGLADKFVLALGGVVNSAIDWGKLTFTRRAEVHRVAQELIRQVQDEGVEWIGFKLWNGYGYTMPLAIAREVKRVCPDVKLFAGGPQADFYYKYDVLRQRTDVFDAISFRGGEEALVGLADWVGSNGRLDRADIPNIVFRDAAGKIKQTEYRPVDLKELPMPDYSEETYPAMQGDQKIKVAVQVDMIGCYWNKCAFCGYKFRTPDRVSQKTPEQVFAEMRALMRQGIFAFRFSGATLGPAFHNRLADLILASGVQIKFAAFVRAQEMDALDLEKLKRAGLDSVMLGVESGSPTLLKSMHKGEEAATLERQIKRFKAAGVFVVASLIGFPPGQTDQTFQETVDFLKRAQPDAIVYTPPLAIPGTDWWDNAGTNNVEIVGTKAEAIAAALIYSIRHLVPPALWPPMPYMVNGLTSRQFLKEVDREAGVIQAQTGIPSRISDDLALFAHLLGKEPVAFRDEVTRMFIAADTEAIDRLVRTLNAAMLSLYT